MTTVNEKLKCLRDSAEPTLSIREMAEKLGVSPGTYHNYERPNGYKGRFLPMDMARRIARILADHGVNPDEVLALAGIGIDEASTPNLSAGEEVLLGSFRQLTPAQRRLLQQMADQMQSASVGPVQAAPAGISLHSAASSYRPHPKEHA